MSAPASVQHFLEHGELSNPGRHRDKVEVLPDDVDRLVRAVRGLLVHSDWLSRYDLNPTGFVSLSRETLPVAAKLDQVMSLESQPLDVERLPSRRAIATCRDYALMLCAFLREKSISARVRCGFAKYFAEGRFEDHWVCEYWNPDSQCWSIADAQLDDQHCSRLEIGFNTVELPSGEFLTAAQAWHEYRCGKAEGAQFGHGDAAGPWFLRVNLARDFLALCKRETSCWDTWRAAAPESYGVDAAILKQCDELARSISKIDARFHDFERQPMSTQSALTPFWSQ